VPPGYAKLGLTDQQKESLYKVQAKYYSQIQALEKQADALRAKREAEFEAVLTPAQKKRLAEQEQQRKAESAARKAAATKAQEKAGG
jgi:Spy/CpxP family protein refolding chaperone